VQLNGVNLSCQPTAGRKNVGVRSYLKNSSLKIAMLSMHSSPLGNIGEKDTGGMSTYLRELSCEMGKMGLQVDIFTRSTGVGEDEKIKLLGPGARLIHIEAGPQHKVNKERLPDFVQEFAVKLDDYRNSEGLCYDVIFSHYWISGLVGEELQKSWQVPHINMFHTLGVLKNAAGIGKPDPRARLETEKKLARDCSHTIVPTAREKKKLTLYYGVSPAKISVIPCGVNLERFRPLDKEAARANTQLSREEKIALFVGRPDPIKGLEQLLKALNRLPYAASLRLVVVGGNGNDIARWDKFCRELQIPFPVTFRGTVEHHLMPYYYNAADFCVVPSYYESFGLAALEAMACGIPVLAADVGELKKIIRQGETGYIVPSNSPEALATMMETLLKNPGNYDLNVVRNTVSGYGWPEIAGRVVRKCQEVIAANSFSKRRFSG